MTDSPNQDKLVAKPQPSQKLNLKGCLIAGLITLAVLLVLAVGAIWAVAWNRMWNPWVEDGPFHGTPAASIPERAPDQTFSLYDRFTLEVFDPAEKDPAPVVVLRDKDRTLKWSIYATAYDPESKEVTNIRFIAWRHWPFKEPRAVAVVEWTFGREGSWWFISREGELKEYYYSW